MNVKFQRNNEEVTLKSSIAEAENKIKERLLLGRNLLQKQITNEDQLKEAIREKEKWHSGNIYIIEQLFSGNEILYDYSPPWGVVSAPSPALSQKLDRYVNQILEYINGLESIEELLNTLKDYEKEEEPVIEANRWTSKKVFVAYGHDRGAKDMVVRFVEKLELEAVVLDEKGSGGSITIIEKLFRETADVGFAIILFTPDDMGSAKDAPLSPRARQNVILELGYFLSKLGREKVVVLKKSDVEVPTDYSGVIYIDFDDNDGWHLKVAGELKKANIPFNASKLIPA